MVQLSSQGGAPPDPPPPTRRGAKGVHAPDRTGKKKKIKEGVADRRSRERRSHPPTHPLTRRTACVRDVCTHARARAQQTLAAATAGKCTIRPPSSAPD